jgi:hypothetical protein
VSTRSIRVAVITAVLISGGVAKAAAQVVSTGQEFTDRGRESAPATPAVSESPPDLSAASTRLQGQPTPPPPQPSHTGFKAVATSRLTDNRHFASDVVFGSALGMASGWTVVGQHGRGSFTFYPVPVKGGLGVAGSWFPSHKHLAAESLQAPTDIATGHRRGL